MTISVSLDGEIFEQVIYTKEDDFEQLVADNARTIFGDKAIYIKTKKKMDTSTLGKAIPDGFLIDLYDPDDPKFYIVEVELQEHSFDGHILSQINRLITSCKNSIHRQKLIERLFPLSGDVQERIKKFIGPREVYKFLKDTFDENQTILVIIDGPKPEFKEQMDSHTEWGKMVKVQIINHFKKGENKILTVEPPFEGLQFGDAISPFLEKETTKPSQYTKEFHQKGCNANVWNIYLKLEKEFLRVKDTVKFNSVKSYIGVIDIKTIAKMYFTYKNKLLMEVFLHENEVNKILASKYHQIRVSRISNPNNCLIGICDTDHWDEIQKLVAMLVEKHRET